VLHYIMEEETKLFRKGRFIYADQHPHISSNFRTAWCNFNSFDFLCTSSCIGASFEICKSISKFIVTSWFIPPSSWYTLANPMKRMNRTRVSAIRIYVLTAVEYTRRWMWVMSFIDWRAEKDEYREQDALLFE